MQKEPRTSAQVEAVKRIQTQRRARRGLVAGYIHELSARHAEAQPKAAAVKAA